MTQNPYLYGGCNPTNNEDASGRDFWDYAGACAQGAGEGLIVGAAFGGISGGSSIAITAGVGFVQGLITQSADGIFGDDLGTLAGSIYSIGEIGFKFL